MADDQTAFRDFKSHPTADSLIRLLRAHQERVYRLCLQVLRRAHDAEDAAQEVLIRIVDGVRKIDDADAFRRWAYRVSLNAALEAARKASRRRTHESRAAMENPPGKPLDEESRRSLFEAIARLDEGPRSLVLDHYFEGETLESLGSREGVSAQAVSKRLDRAREELKRALPATFMGLPDLGRLFERGTSAPAVPDLVSGPVLVKVAAIAGGAVVTTKSLLLPIAIAALLAVCLGVGIVALNFRLPTDAPGEHRAVRPRTDPEPGTTAADNVDLPLTKVDSGATESEGETTVPHLSALRTRLKQFKQWWFAREKSGWGEDPGRNQHDKELWEQVSGLRSLIMADPEEFLAFLKDPENEGMLQDLTQMNPLTQTDKPYVEFRKAFSEYPQALMRDLFDLLHSGTVRQRVATFRLLSGFSDPPEEFRNAYLAFMDDPNPEVQSFAIYLVRLTVPLTPPLFSKLEALGRSDSLFVRQAVNSAMAAMPGSAGEAYLLNRMETVTNHSELFGIIFSLEMRYERARQVGQANLEEHLARAVAAVVARGDDIRVYRLMQMASNLSGTRLKPILMQIMAKTNDDEFRGRLNKAVERIDQGSVNRDDLMKILDPQR